MLSGSTFVPPNILLTSFVTQLKMMRSSTFGDWPHSGTPTLDPTQPIGPATLLAMSAFGAVVATISVTGQAGSIPTTLGCGGSGGQ